jgi:hypothetical protein
MTRNRHKADIVKANARSAAAVSFHQVHRVVS